MSVGNVGNECPKFNSIIFGENGKYRATRNGNQVIIQGKDGSIRTTDVKTFITAMTLALPKMNAQPNKDSFVKGQEVKEPNVNFLQNLKDKLEKYHNSTTFAEEVKDDDNILIKIAKGMANTSRLIEKKETDNILERLNKSIHNQNAILVNPTAYVEYIKNPGKY